MIVLRSKVSGYFFKAFGEWVPCPEAAQCFRDEWSARAFARSEHVEDVTPISLRDCGIELPIA